MSPIARTVADDRAGLRYGRRGGARNPKSDRRGGWFAFRTAGASHADARRYPARGGPFEPAWWRRRETAAERHRQYGRPNSGFWSSSVAPVRSLAMSVPTGISLKPTRTAFSKVVTPVLGSDQVP